MKDKAMPLDLAKVREETPAVETLIHFNNAGAALMPQPVLNAVIEHLQLEAQIGGYEAAKLKRDAHERAYTAIAELINAQPDEIALVENATRAWDMAFYSLKFEAGDKIITAQSEYSSNFIPFLQAKKKAGIEIVIIPDDEFGQVDVNALEAAIDKRVKLIAITHVPSTGGLINPAEAIGEIAKRHKILYLLDACQSVGQLQVDLQKIGCDFLSVTGRKFLRAPRGIGFLYAKRSAFEMLEPVFLDTHAATWISPESYTILPSARRFENWESNISTRIGLAVAVDYALDIGMDVIEERVLSLSSLLREELSSIEGVQIRDWGLKLSGIVTFTIDGKDSYEIRDTLSKQKINVSVSPKEYTLLDFEARDLPDLVRASVHYYNTEAEVKIFCDAVKLLSA
jgi:cysteine desulfurase/selenocysteine lyase